MHNLRSYRALTAEQSEIWEKISKDPNHPTDAIIDFVIQRCKDTGLVAVVGWNGEVGIYFGAKASGWQYVFLASKPRGGYLKCLGNGFKCYPSGKVTEYCYGSKQIPRIIRDV